VLYAEPTTHCIRIEHPMIGFWFALRSYKNWSTGSVDSTTETARLFRCHRSRNRHQTTRIAAQYLTNPSPGLFLRSPRSARRQFHTNNGNVFSVIRLRNHASHVAGIVGAKGDNSIGVVGVNWDCRLMSSSFSMQLVMATLRRNPRLCLRTQMRDRFLSSEEHRVLTLRLEQQLRWGVYPVIP